MTAFMSNTLPSFQPGLRLRIYLGESQIWQGKPLSHALLELARNQGLAGATIYKGVEGFGPEHFLSTERLPDVAINLPVIVEIVDQEAAITRLLPYLDSMVPRGMITSSPVQILVRGEQA
jgi:PII-like signaling protein